MATIFDLIEVTDITAHTTYSEANGNLLGVVDGAVSGEFDDGEFDENDIFTIDDVPYQITLLQEPASSGSFTAGDGSTISFDPRAESELDVIFLSASDGTNMRYFIIPSDRYGDLNFQSIRTGELNDVGGNDAALVSTTNNDTNIVCFSAGTMIELGDGSECPVEDLSVGMSVATLDRGAQPIRWIGHRNLTVPTMLCHPRLRPIRIPAGSCAPGCPRTDLRVSPQHRVLVRSRIAQRMFGSDEVLVAARNLIGVNGIDVDRSTWTTTYVHLLLDGHEILSANGLPCESLYLGPQSRKSLGGDAMEEIGLILGGHPQTDQRQTGARPFITGRRARRMSARHRQNKRPLVGAA